MERIDGTKSENKILRKLFRSAEVSYLKRICLSTDS